MSTPTTDEDMLRGWIGRSETHQDDLAVGQATRMAATLDRMQEPAEGAALPPLWHWIYFNEAVARSALGRDGHARRGGDKQRRDGQGERQGKARDMGKTSHGVASGLAGSDEAAGGACRSGVRGSISNTVGDDGATPTKSMRSSGGNAVVWRGR